MLLLQLQLGFSLTFEENVTNCLMNRSEFISFYLKYPHQGFNIPELDKPDMVKRNISGSLLALRKGSRSSKLSG